MTPLLHSAERLYDIAVHDYGPWTEEDVRKNCEAEYWLPYPDREKFEVAATMVNVLPSYRYYAFLDDDLTVDALTLNRLFLVGDCLGLDLYQPSLTIGSYISHNHLQQPKEEFNPVRKVPFVEIMCPFMSRRMVERASPMFDLTQSAWGLDCYVWPKMVGACYVIDSLPVAHLRRPDRRDRVQRNGLTPAQECEIVRKIEYDGIKLW
jgi:hypothetical protein